MDFHLPELGEGVYEAEFVAWLVKPGDVVKSGQNLLEVMTDKATMEVPSPFSGTITGLHAKPGQKVKIGNTILSYTPAKQPDDGVTGRRGDGVTNNIPAVSIESRQPTVATVSTAARHEITPSPRHPVTPSGSPVTPSRVKAAPSVRHLARKLGVDLSRVRGSGPDGRILIEDLSTHMQPATAAAAKKASPAPVQDLGRPGTRIKLQGLRRLIAEHMVTAARTIPHYSYVDECDVTALVQLREQLRDHFGKKGAKLTYLAFLVKAAVAALKEVPLVNASLDEQAEEIVLHDHYHIGVAVATPGGLIVPVIHDADRKSLEQIAGEIERLSSAARSGKVRREEVRGGTFTITSVGSLGGLFSTPIINHPEVAILGTGKIVKRPVFDEQGQVKPADMLYLSLSFDHRVVDGAVGAIFANAVIRHLQKPALLLLS